MARLFKMLRAKSRTDVMRTRHRRRCFLESLEGRQLLAGDVTLFADSFESGGSSNDWAGNWVEDSQNDWFRSTQRSTDGVRSAEVDGWASNATLSMSNSIDLSGYESAELTFDWLIERGFDSGEYLALDISSDGGSSWDTSVLQLDGNSDPENQWRSETVDLTPYASSDLLVRFRATVSRSNEDANVDNVRITGELPSTPEVSISDATVLEGSSGFAFSDAFVAAGSGGLLSARGITFGPDGNFYAVSTDTDSVLRYDGVTGDFLDEFVTSGSGGLDFPREISFHNGDLYVVSSTTNAVLRYSGATGAFIDEFVSAGEGGLERPRGLLFGDNNDLYVTSAGDGDAVLRYNATTGAFVDEFIPTGTAGLSNPTRIVSGPDGNFYVSSTASDSNSVLRFDPSGNFIDTFIAPGSGGLDGPSSMVFRSGLFYVAGFRSNSVVAFDADNGTPHGTIVAEAGLGPNSMVFDDAGRLYVSSRAANQVLRYTDASLALLSVRLTNPSDEIVTVDFNSVDGSALSGSDFVSASGTLTFEAGVTDRVIAVRILAETAAEPDEIFDVQLSNASNADLADATGQVTIVERRISVSDASETEGDVAPHYRGPFVDGLPGGHFNPLTFGPDGNVYTAVGTGSGYNTVQRFDGTTGQFIDTFIDNSDPDHKINGVRDIVFHPSDGMVYVASSYTDEVLRYDALTGAFVDVFVTANSGGIDHPDGMMFGPDFNNDGNPELYVTGWLSDSVVRYDGVTGAPLGTYVAAGSGGLSFPFSLAFRQDELFVTSAGTNQILKYDAQSGDFLGVAATTGLDYPRGLTFGPDDLLYVTSGDNDRIIRFNPSGQYVDDYVPAGIAGMDRPRTPRFGSDGDLYVTVTGKNEIMKFGEQNEAIFTLNLSLPSNDPVVVDFSTAPIGVSPATSGTDFDDTTGQVVFAPGTTQRFINVPINDDSEQESDETFELVVSLPQPVAGFGVSDGQGIGTIIDDGDVGNQAPTADAGADQTLSDNDGTGSEVVTLSGSGIDTDGSIVAYEWTDGENVIGSAATISPSLDVGTHKLTLTATDNGGATSSDSVVVTIVANQAPTAAAGADQSITDSDDNGSETVTLSGSGSDVDGAIVSYQWTEGATVLGDTASISPSLSVGTHTLTLTVTDNGGASTSDDVVITIVEPANQGPTADAGADQTLSDNDGTGSESVTLVGSGSDPDGTIVAYQWTEGATVLGNTADISPSLTIGTHTLTFTVTDDDGATASDSVTVTVEAAPAGGPNLSHGNVASVGSSWQTVTLGKSYTSMVVVATPRYNDGSGPGVVRINNVTANSFDVRVDNAGLSAFSGGVHYIAVEEGVYDESGFKLEAVKYDEAQTSRRSDWGIDTVGYQQSYSSPVVVGQVMSANDEDWSVFWASSGSRTSPPSPSALNVGKHVAEDPDTNRATETIGYLVIEATQDGTIEGLPFVAGVGGDSVRGVGNGTNQYSYDAMPNAKTAVLSSAGMDGNDGGWAVLRGDNPVPASSGTISLSIDEDQLRDTERNHTTEQVAYFVIDPPADPDPMDVNGDGSLTALDALQIVNRLSRIRDGEGELLPARDDRMDVNSDGNVTALDALQVINRLARQPVPTSIPMPSDWSPSVVDEILAGSNHDDEDEWLELLADA